MANRITLSRLDLAQRVQYDSGHLPLRLLISFTKSDDLAVAKVRVRDHEEPSEIDPSALGDGEQCREFHLGC